jgi:hypothetical protein
MKTSFSDEMAMNWINDLLNERGDMQETIEMIYKIVRLTGREINPIENKE